MTAPTVAETVAATKAEILDLIAEGVIPADVDDFGQLHDYVDANTLGGMCDDGFPERFGPQAEDRYNDAWMEHCNAVQDIVHDWLKAGRP